MPLAICDADSSASCFKLLKKLCWPWFDHLDLTNAMLPLMMSSVSYDANTGTSSITCPRKSGQIFFQWPSPIKHNDAIYDAISITWHQWWHQWHHMTEKSCYTSFWSFCPMNALMPFTTPLAPKDISRHYLDMSRHIRTSICMCHNGSHKNFYCLLFLIIYKIYVHILHIYTLDLYLILHWWYI